MSSRSVAPLGGQAPRVRVAPKFRESDADDAAFLSSAYGLKPDPWQLGVLEDWLAVRKDGRFASLTCGLAVPRQNGKNGIIEVRELFGMVALGEKFLHTAHEVKTARKAFLRLCSFFENTRKHPELAALVKEIRKTNGQEAIVLTNGGSVEFVARSKGSGRGFTVDVLVMDEAQELSDDALEALMPTTSAAPLGNPQWILTGTPPGPSANGEVFTRTRDEALGGKSARLCWHEWSCDGAVDLDDRDNWYAANPSLGGRLQFDVLEGERARFSDDGFGRERLGMWASASGSQVISMDAWKLAADPQSMPTSGFAIAVDVSPDLTSAALSLAGERPDGSWHVEVYEHRAGADWVANYVAGYVKANPQIRAVVVDVGSPAAAIVDDLVKAKVKITTPAVRDIGVAFTRFVDGVKGGTVRHTGQVQMATALGGARRRALGATGLSAWNRVNSSADITPIVSATLALWGAQNTNVKRPGPSTEKRRVVVL